MRQRCTFVCFCCLLQDVTAVLDGIIEEAVEAAVREVAHAGAAYATTALA